MKPSRILIIFTAFLLLLSLSASVLAAQPKQGVYVKQDSAGKISALMYVISKQGKGPLASAGNELSITLEALDDQGTVTEQLVSDYVEGEAAVAGDRGAGSSPFFPGTFQRVLGAVRGI